MRLIEKFFLVVNIVFGIYVYWISSMFGQIVAWPTLNLFLLTLTPALFFILLRFISIFTQAIPRFPSPKLILFVFIGFTIQILSEDFTKSSISEYKYESVKMFDDQNEVTCAANFKTVLRSNLNIHGHCSLLVYSHNKGATRYYTSKKQVDECKQSIQTACKELCGNFFKNKNDTVYSFLVNFGPEKNFNEFHLPFSKVQTLAVVSCDSDRRYNRRHESHIVDELTF